MSESDRRQRITSPAKRERGRITRISPRSLLLLQSQESRSVAHEALRDAFDEQMSLLAAGRFDKFQGQTDADFLNAFFLDPLFIDLYAETKEMASHCQDSDIGFQRRIKGAMFEKMAYAYLSASQTGSDVPLMGKDVVEIARVINTNRRVNEFGLGQVGIAGVYVPDGFMVNVQGGEPIIVGVLECKVGSGLERVEKQKNAAQYELQKYGFLANPNPYFKIILPKFDIPVSVPDEAGVIILPVEQHTFEHEFFNLVYYKHRVGDGKTLYDLRQKRYAATTSPVGNF
jgi:hypothetical protein